MFQSKGIAKRLIPLVFLVLSLAACTGTNPARGTAATPDDAIEASGFLEAREISVVSEVAGRVDEVLVGEAETVTAGQEVLRLDDGLLQAQRIQALAAVAIAEANLRRLEAGPTQEELAAARAGLEEAEAAVRGAQITAGTAWQAANNPTQVDIAIAGAQTEADLAQQQMGIIQAQIEEQQFLLNLLQSDTVKDETRIDTIESQIAALQAQLRAAEAQRDGALQKLEELYAQRDRPLAEIATARQASAQVPIAEARLEAARAQYDLVAHGATPEEIAIAQAQVALAEASVGLVDARLSQLVLTAPIDGVITTRAINVGETVSPGVPLLAISTLDVLELVVYIPEPQIGRVNLGAPVTISVDAYPGQTFEGTVVYISSEAEFTPRNVQTEEERVNLVFAVEVRIDNPDGRLKPGMPADVVIAG